jgi:hypothetical protein
MKLSPLEKSHLASLAKGEPWAATTDGDFKALDKLVKAGFVRREVDGAVATEKGKRYIREGKNIFSQKQIAHLHKWIKSGKYWVPRLGDLIYVQTHLYLDHGEDDEVGGLAQVTRVYRGMSGGDSKCVFVEVAQHDGGHNWTQFLHPDQEELMKEFGTQVGYPDPDTRPQFNEGWR